MAATVSAVDAARAAIEARAREVQALPEDVRWLFCDSAWIVAAATGAPPEDGKAAVLISRVLRAAAVIGAETLLARTAALALLFRLWLRQGRAAPTPSPYFIGIRALREAELVPRFEADVGQPASVIDQRDPTALAAVGAVGWSGLFQAWRESSGAAARYLASPGTSRDVRMAALNRLVRKLHIYSYSLAVFRALRARDPGTPVAFSTCDLPAHAAVAAGLPAFFYQHGFLRRSLIVPHFERAVALNGPEADHIRARSPETRVSTAVKQTSQAAAERRLVLAGEYEMKDPEVCRSLIDAARAAGVDVVARPHPADRSSFWADLDDDRLTIDREGTFDAFLARQRPAFLATWFSTTLIDALERGVLPITLDAGQADIVFPMQDIALTWPRDRVRVLAAMADENERLALIETRRRDLMGGMS